VPRRSPFALRRIVEHMAERVAPRHRELVHGMVSELDAIADPAERTRFALGALAAIVRLALSRYSETTAHALGRFVGVTELEHGPNPGGPSMSKLATRQLLRRHATPFAVSLVSLTLLLLTNYAARQVPQLSARGVPAGTIVAALLLAVPFTLAMTMPMAVFIAVSWVFTRLGAEGVLSAAQRERHGVRRLIAPVFGAAAVIATLTLVSNTQVLPRANARLAAVLAGAPRAGSRTMTIGELREAARGARAEAGPDAAAHVAAYEIEIHKKFSLAAACVVLALAAAAIALRFPRGGTGLVLGASGVVFAGYYVSLMTGESLAHRQMVSPFVAMWMANAVCFAVVLLLLWRPGGPRAALGTETLAIGG
jgi:lipopolysaccharide export LptBFGC system permease protein LptF